MVAPELAFQSHTWATKFLRPRSCRDWPASCNCRSTTICVAMPAWSVPGSHSVLWPRMRCQRVSASMMVWLNACPMCRVPVTLGGGSWMRTRAAAGPASAQSSRPRSRRVPSGPRWRRGRRTWRGRRGSWCRGQEKQARRAAFLGLSERWATGRSGEGSIVGRRPRVARAGPRGRTACARPLRTRAEGGPPPCGRRRAARQQAGRGHMKRCSPAFSPPRIT
jgi:hypothetical protein